MKKLAKIIGLPEEALLFDSKLYIIKAVLAVSTGYILGKALPITRLDMISVLVGVMYNLEPTNLNGLKGGLSQLFASAIGAACTAIMIGLFGINVFTIGISMALTLYVSLKLNWRFVSPVAIFTCVYMTQLVQHDIYGNSSIWLTLRIAALGLGILVAMFFNFVVSYLYYRKMAYKRMQFARKRVVSGLEYTCKQVGENSENHGREYITVFPDIFNDLDLVYSNIESMLQEARHFHSRLQPDKLLIMQGILRSFRDINHMAYDVNFQLSHEENHELKAEFSELLKESISLLDSIDFTYKKVRPIRQQMQSVCIQSKERLEQNLSHIREFASNAAQEASTL
jgi:ElaB/YqjD/DUF883 family membrane-anchored ribosome-binding protein